ncbi:hypothetical protein EVA_10679 [gut metagenome]|uniref:Uncharacterized protein n=1 Tax=gut metagenome TaxID=749906 RepID=J9GH82_9ZZZZ
MWLITSTPLRTSGNTPPPPRCILSSALYGCSFCTWCGAIWIWPFWR